MFSITFDRVTQNYKNSDLPKVIHRSEISTFCLIWFLEEKDDFDRKITIG
jgi:hypothetical protein